MIATPDIDMAVEAARQGGSCAARLRLPLRHRVWRGGAGELAGAGSGASLDFQDHRNYLPGDDPRHINWAAYARTGHYSMKLFREEVRPTVEILLDTSPSMFLTPEKARRACELFAFTREAARREAAATALHLIDSTSHHPLDPDEFDSGEWIERIASAPNRPTPAGPPAPPRLDAPPLRPGSFRVWITDLLFPASPATLLRELLRHRGSGILLAPYVEAEAEPTWSGACDFHDVESGRVEARDVDAGLRRRYLATYQAHFATWKEEALRHHLPLARVPAAPPLGEALAAEALAVRALEPIT